MRRGETITDRPVLDCCWTVIVLVWDCCWTAVGLVLDGIWTGGGQLAMIIKAGEGVMIRAGVGVGEDREARVGGEGSVKGESGTGLMAADRSASRGEGEAVGWTRMRPSSGILWSLCLFQHG